MATAAISVTDACAGRQAGVTHAGDALLGDQGRGPARRSHEALERRTEEILEANARDLEAAGEADYAPALSTGCAWTRARVAAMAAGLRKIASLPDPVGEVIDGSRLPNGLDLRKVRVPLGVVAVVYEARPNVTIDADGAVPEIRQRGRPPRFFGRSTLQRGARADRGLGGGGSRPARGGDHVPLRAGARRSPSWQRRRARST